MVDVSTRTLFPSFLTATHIVMPPKPSPRVNPSNPLPKVVKSLMEKGDAFHRSNFEWHVRQYFQYLVHHLSGGSEVLGTFEWQGVNVFGGARTMKFFNDSRFAASGVTCGHSYHKGSVNPQYFTFGPQTVLYGDRKYEEKRQCNLDLKRVKEHEDDYKAFRNLFWERLESATARPDVQIDHVRTVNGLDVGCFHDPEPEEEEPNNERWNTNRVAFDIAQHFNDRAASGHYTRLILEDATHCEWRIKWLKAVFEHISQGHAMVDVLFSRPCTAIDPGDPTRTPEIVDIVQGGELRILSRFGFAHLDEDAFVIATNTTFNLRQIFADFAKDIPNGGPAGILCRKIEGDGVKDRDDLDPSSINLLAYKNRCLEIDIGDDTGLAIYLRKRNQGAR